MAKQYVETSVGILPNHNFVKHYAQGDEFESLPGNGSEKLHYVIECFVDDYISLVIPTSQEKLRHVANAAMNGIHYVFTSDAEDDKDSTSLKKLKKRSHNVTWKRKCWIFNFMASKRQLFWQPRNVTPY